MRKYYFLLLLVSCFSFKTELLHAQLNAIPTSIEFETFNNKNGLSQGYVSSIVQDMEGFMWFATSDGLNKFDGYQVKVYHYDPDDQYSIADNAVLQLVEDEQGNFWVGTSTKGLLLFDKKLERFYHVPLATDTNSLGNPILQLQCNGDKLMVRHADDFCIYNIHGFGLETLLAQPQKQLQRLFSFKTKMEEPLFNYIKKEHRPDYNWTWWLPDNSIWRVYMDTVYTLTPDKNFQHWTTAAVPIRFFGMESAKTVFILPGINNSTKAFVSSNAIIMYDQQQKRITHQISFSDKGEPYDNYWFNKPFRLPNGTIFFYTREGYHSFDPHNYNIKKYISKNDGRFGGPAHFTDRDGILWTGTAGYGICKYNTRREQFNTLNEEVNGFAESPDKQMNIFFKKTGTAVFTLPYKLKEPFVPQKIWPQNWTMPGLFCIDKRGIKWFFAYEKGTPNYHLARFDPYKQKVEEHNEFYFKEGVPGGLLGFFTDAVNDVWHLYYCFDNTRKLVHSDGITLATKEVFTLPVPKDLNKQASFINSIWQDDVHNIFWMGSVQGLFRFDKTTKEWKLYKNNPKDINSISSDNVISVCADPSNPEKYLWAGTNGGGFNRFEMATGKCKRYSEKDGLPNNVVYGILSDAAGNLWMSTNQGLSCFNIQKESFRNYTDADGLPGNEFNRGQLIKASTGQLFFGGVDGLTWFYPAEVLKKVQPANNIVISRFLVSNKPVDFKKDSSILNRNIQYCRSVTLPYEKNMFSIEFTLLQFTLPEKKHYRYKLDGFDKDWIDNGAKNSVTYTNLDPGSYTFHVTGSNSDGVWNEKGATLIINITPPWYRTLWFRILLSVFIVGSLYAFYRYRLHQSLKVISMRNIIASDLHDEIGSTISSITVYSDIIEEKVQDKDLQQIARRISDSSRNILVVMSDIVWSINPKNDRFDNVLIRMKSFAHEVMDIQNKQLHFESDEQLNELKLQMNNRKNFYLIFKEALNNVVKYAGAKNVWITVQLINDNIHFTIKDDGIGFDTTEYKEGNGIANMQRRSKDLHGNISIQSQPGAGTEIRLQFPV